MHAQDHQVERLLTPKEVMAYYQISKQTVTNWVRRGCPVVKLPGNHRFERHAVAAWIESQSTK